MKVALFVTCLVDQLFPEVGRSVVRLLERLGCQVSFPTAQICCGQPAYNAGYVDDARKVARGIVECFESADYVVSPSGSCSGMVRHHYGELFAGDRAETRARELSCKLYEFSQFMTQVLKLTDIGAVFPHRVTYHPSCHAIRLLRVGDEPLVLIRAIREIDYRELRRAEDCCGFGGTFAVKLSRVSAAITDEKIDHIVETGARYVIGTDFGCLANIQGRMQARGLDVRTLHLAELLDRATEGGNGSAA